MENDKLKLFAQLCGLSRHVGMSSEMHNRKIALANELIAEGLMSKEKMHNFVNEEDSKYFFNVISNFMWVTVIAAVAANNAIGKDNKLLWKNADDMAFFKDVTNGHVVISGRKNYESIPEKFRPLPNRQNIVVTRNPDYKAEGAIVVGSLEQAIEHARGLGAHQCFIIGGGEIYKEALEKNMADELLISAIEDSPEADTFFPEITSGWNKETLGSFEADKRNQCSFTINRYRKI